MDQTIVQKMEQNQSSRNGAKPTFRKSTTTNLQQTNSWVEIEIIIIFMDRNHLTNRRCRTPPIVQKHGQMIDSNSNGPVLALLVEQNSHTALMQENSKLNRFIDIVRTVQNINHQYKH
jgi:hypothetical protein